MSRPASLGAALLLAALYPLPSADAEEMPYFRLGTNADALSPSTPLSLAPPLALSFADAYVGDGASGRISARNASGAVSFEVVEGSLPPGISLARDGTLAGTLRSSATGSFKVRAMDTAGRSGEASIPYSVQVPTASLTGIPRILRSGATATGTLATNLTDATWQLSAVPSDLVLIRDGAAVTLTAPSVMSGTTYEIQASARRATGAQVAAAVPSLSVYPLPAFTGALQESYALKEGESLPYVTLAPVTGSLVGAPLWSLFGAPAGVVIDSAGGVGGKPAATGRFDVQAIMRDSGDLGPYGQVAKPFTVTVTASSRITAASSLTVASVTLPATTGTCTELSVTNEGSVPASAPTLSVTSGEFQACAASYNPCTASTNLSRNASCNVGAQLVSSQTAGGKFGTATVQAGGGTAPIAVSLNGSTDAQAFNTADLVGPTNYGFYDDVVNSGGTAPMYGLDGSTGGSYLYLVNRSGTLWATYGQPTYADCARIVPGPGGFNNAGLQILGADVTGRGIGTTAVFYPSGGAGSIYTYTFSTGRIQPKTLFLTNTTTRGVRIAEFRPGIMVSGSCVYH